MPSHGCLYVFPNAEAGDVDRSAVLAAASGERGRENNKHRESKIDAGRNGAENDGGEGEKGEACDIEDKGEHQVAGVVSTGLEVREDSHKDEVCDCGDGK